MTHQYRRYARRVGITSSLKELPHYSATQLLAAGTDLNTVAGRLGHAEGSTTLKFCAVSYSSRVPPTRPPPPSQPGTTATCTACPTGSRTLDST